ncbi:MAG: class I SAM-dependent methyltransferase [Acidobacteria bacterium]|nr:MAG: class I SAM-dependent methyltransferase [Acidobacteriota bacterium]
MLASRDFPASYRQWNRGNGSPAGFRWRGLIPPRHWTKPVAAKMVGCFAFQRNNGSRTFEYPWAFEALDIFPGAKVLEIGGGLSGLQFVLSRCGCEVTNVDPGMAAHGVGWPVDQESVNLLNRRFGTSVCLKNCFIEDAGLANESFDRVFSISAIEHIPPDDVLTILEHVRRVLKPGGLFVLTVDLFLDLKPFTRLETNKFGRNISIRWLIENSGLELAAGRPEELYGFDAFSPGDILERLPQFFIGSDWPTLTQALVLRKWEGRAARKPDHLELAVSKCTT